MRYLSKFKFLFLSVFLSFFVPYLVFASTNVSLGGSATSYLEFGCESICDIGVSQDFVPSVDQTVVSINIPLQKIGTPTDSLYVELREDSSGLPGALLDTSDSISGTSLSILSFSLETFTFTGGVNLTAGTRYWFWLRRDGSNNNYNYYYVGYDDTGNYGLGYLRVFDGTNWNVYGTPDYSLSESYDYDDPITPPPPPPTDSELLASIDTNLYYVVVGIISILAFLFVDFIRRYFNKKSI